jgi:ubiquinone/menaquinone biosynthesis C-methylase UbiE
MASERKNRVCPVEHAGSLDNRIRGWLQNPRKILGPFVEEGMTVLDIGCGPGFFSIEMAEMVGPAGRVIASDLQEGMLDKVRDKIQGTRYAGRIIIHNSEKEGLDILEDVDFVLAFYVVHEVPDKEKFFREIWSLLRPGGQVLIVEPPFHVSKAELDKTVQTAREAGFTDARGPSMFFSKTSILRKPESRV